MSNKKYKQGYNFELQLKNTLEKVGFPLVIRSAGSHGPVDVAAIGHDSVFLFQCKSTEKTVVTNTMVNEIFKNKRVKDLTNLPARCIKILAFKAKGMSEDEWLFYRWTITVNHITGKSSNEWKYIANKLF